MIIKNSNDVNDIKFDVEGIINTTTLENEFRLESVIFNYKKVDKKRPFYNCNERIEIKCTPSIANSEFEIIVKN